MKPFQPIQSDFEGTYNDMSGISCRNNPKVDLESKIPDLLERAKAGDNEAIEILKNRYKMKTYIAEGKTIF